MGKRARRRTKAKPGLRRWTDLDAPGLVSVFTDWINSDRSDPALRDRLLSEAIAAREHEDPEVRNFALSCFGDVLTPESGELVWHALATESDDAVVSTALSAAFMHVLKRGSMPTPLAVRRLKKLVRDTAVDSQVRWFALEFLVRAQVHGLKALLVSVASSDPAEDVRRRANGFLLPYGLPTAKRAVMADIRANPGHYGVAGNLWFHRERFHFTQAEERDLRRAMERYAEILQTRVQAPDCDPTFRDHAMTELTYLKEEGFAVDEGLLASLPS